MLATMLASTTAMEGADKPPGEGETVIALDSELTSLSWLQKPGVLTSMCTALTGSPHHVNKPGSRAMRRPRQAGKDGLGAGSGGGKETRMRTRQDSDKMVNVILNVRNRKYNGEDAQKPPLSFACMIFMALESSATKTLPVKEIYEWIQWKFPFYRSAPPGWKNSVRHNLSLNKCFKKVTRGLSRSKTTLSKGGLWTVDPDYRRSLLAALKRSPYHPYHSYFTPPLSPSSSCCSLDSLDPAERDAALTMCMIGGGSDGSPAGILYAVYHDHCYAKRPPKSPSNKGLSLAEVAAAAEMILEQDKMEGESSDEGIGGEESECEEVEEEEEEEDEEEGEGEDVMEEREHSLADSGYGGAETPPSASSAEQSCTMEELGVNALLALAGGHKSSSVP